MMEINNFLLKIGLLTFGGIGALGLTILWGI